MAFSWSLCRRASVIALKSVPIWSITSRAGNFPIFSKISRQQAPLMVKFNKARFGDNTISAPRNTLGASPK